MDDCRCPHCKREYQRDVNRDDPPSRARGKYLVFCGECIQEHYSGFDKLRAEEPLLRRPLPERDRKVGTLMNPGANYTSEEAAFLLACDHYRDCLGRPLAATDYLRVVKLMGYER